MGNLHCCDESIKGKTELPTLVEHKDKESPLVVSNKSIQPVSFQLEESSKEFCKSNISTMKINKYLNSTCLC